MSERGVRMVAVSAALVAVVLSGIAAITVIGRGGAPALVVTPGSGVARSSGGVDLTVPVAATDVVKLRREAVTAVIERGETIGVRVTDGELRKRLGLLEADVITGLSGRQLKREWDVLDAISGTSMLEPRTIFVEVRRDGAPVLVRWAIEGDLRAARRAAVDTSTLRLPSVAAVADPLVATITQTDDTHFVMPRDTADRLIADPMTYLKGARGFPSTSLRSTPGFRVYAVRPQTVIAALGLANGDVVRGLNGFDTPTLDRFGEVLGMMKTATTWTIDIERRRLPIIVTITIK